METRTVRTRIFGITVFKLSRQVPGNRKEASPMTLEDRITAALASAMTDDEFARAEQDWENAE